MTDEERIAYLAGTDAGPADSADADEKNELDDIRALLADPSLWVEPDPALPERVVDAVAAAGAAPRPELSAAPESELAPRPSRRRRYALLAAAAAVLLAVGLGVGLSVGLSGSSGHPEEFTAALSGTALAPGASGQATLTKTANGWRIHIDATGLPRRDDNAYYEAWLKDAGGVLVPIGTFNQAHDVTLWSGVAPTDFPTLTITRQAVGAGQESSGQVVLAAPTRRIH
jgi:Anti-sigma-K factor rskA